MQWGREWPMVGSLSHHQYALGMSQTRSQKPRLAALPAILFAGGLGMVFWYGHALSELPRYSPAEIEQSVELNLMLDLQRRDPTFANDSGKVSQLRMQLHDEVTAAIAQDKTELQRYIGAGVVMTLVGLAQMLLLRRMAAR